MIAEADRKTITEIAREYKVGKVVLFGSSLREGREPNDIDLGVKGIEPRLFFRFYGELLMRLSKPVDVVDLAYRSRFTELVERDGVGSMPQLRERVLAEKENVELALANLRQAMARRDRSVVELTAAASFVHNVYNGIENILKQVLVARSVDVPKAGAWHQELLRLSVTEKVVSNELAQELKEYLGFRHFFVHGYGFMISEEPLQDLASRLPAVWAKFTSEIEHALTVSGPDIQ